MTTGLSMREASMTTVKMVRGKYTFQTVKFLREGLEIPNWNAFGKESSIFNRFFERFS